MFIWNKAKPEKIPGLVFAIWANTDKKKKSQSGLADFHKIFHEELKIVKQCLLQETVSWSEMICSLSYRATNYLQQFLAAEGI